MLISLFDCRMHAVNETERKEKQQSPELERCKELSVLLPMLNIIPMVEKAGKIKKKSVRFVSVFRLNRKPTQ